MASASALASSSALALASASAFALASASTLALSSASALALASASAFSAAALASASILASSAALAAASILASSAAILASTSALALAFSASSLALASASAFSAAAFTKLACSASSVSLISSSLVDVSSTGGGAGIVAFVSFCFPIILLNLDSFSSSSSSSSGISSLFLEKTNSLPKATPATVPTTPNAILFSSLVFSGAAGTISSLEEREINAFGSFIAALATLLSTSGEKFTFELQTEKNVESAMATDLFLGNLPKRDLAFFVRPNSRLGAHFPFLLKNLLLLMELRSPKMSFELFGGVSVEKSGEEIPVVLIATFFEGIVIENASQTVAVETRHTRQAKRPRWRGENANGMFSRIFKIDESIKEKKEKADAWSNHLKLRSRPFYYILRIFLHICVIRI